MRRIRVEEPRHRAWKRWNRACDSATQLLEISVATGAAIVFKEKLHRPKTIRRIYFFSGHAPFFAKCAYCESALELIDGDIDHFRPRAGYFWLAYQWTNLLPTCKTCNQVYKRAQFPVEGQKATSAADLPAERPLLLDPLGDDPAADPIRHLEVDESGTIVGKSLRGTTTIQVLGLDRDSLRRQRRHAYLAVEALVRRAKDGEVQAREDLEAIVEGKRPFYLTQKIALTHLAARAGI